MPPSGSEVSIASASYPTTIREKSSGESQGESSEKPCERRPQQQTSGPHYNSYGRGSQDSSYETATTATSTSSTRRSSVVDIMASLEEAIAIAREAQELEIATAAEQPSQSSSTQEQHRGATRGNIHNNASCGAPKTRGGSTKRGERCTTNAAGSSKPKRSVADILSCLEEAIVIAKEAKKLEVSNIQSTYGSSPTKQVQTPRSSNQRDSRSGSSGSERRRHSERRGRSVPTKERGQHGGRSSNSKKKASSSSPIRSIRRSHDADDSSVSVTLIVSTGESVRRRSKRSSGSPDRRRRRSRSNDKLSTKKTSGRSLSHSSPSRSRRHTARVGERSSSSSAHARDSSHRQSNGSSSPSQRSRRRRSNELEYRSGNNNMVSESHSLRNTSSSPIRRRWVASVAPVDYSTKSERRIRSNIGLWKSVVSPGTNRKRTFVTDAGERRSESPSHKTRDTSSQVHVEADVAARPSPEKSRSQYTGPGRTKQRSINPHEETTSQTLIVGENEKVVVRKGIEYHLSFTDRTGTQSNLGKSVTSSIASGMVHSAPCVSKTSELGRDKDEVFHVLHASSCSFIPASHNYATQAQRESEPKSVPSFPPFYESSGSRLAGESRWGDTHTAIADNSKIHHDEFSVQTEDSTTSRQTWGEAKEPAYSTPSPTLDHSRKKLSPPGSSPRTVVFPLGALETYTKTPTTKRGTVTIKTPSNKQKNTPPIAPLSSESIRLPRPSVPEGHSWHGHRTTGPELSLHSLSDHTPRDTQENTTRSPPKNSGGALSYSDHGGSLSQPSPLGRAALAKLGVVGTVHRQGSYESHTKRGSRQSKDESLSTLVSHLRIDSESLGKSCGTVQTEPFLRPRLNGSQRSFTKSVVSAHTAPPRISNASVVAKSTPSPLKAKSPSKLTSHLQQHTQSNQMSTSPSTQTEPIPNSGLSESQYSFEQTAISASPREFHKDDVVPPAPTNDARPPALDSHLHGSQSTLGKSVLTIQTEPILSACQQNNAIMDEVANALGLSPDALEDSANSKNNQNHVHGSSDKKSGNKASKGDAHQTSLAGILASPRSPRKLRSGREVSGKVTFDSSVQGVGKDVIEESDASTQELPISRNDPLKIQKSSLQGSRQRLEKRASSPRAEPRSSKKVHLRSESPRAFGRKQLSKSDHQGRTSAKSSMKANLNFTGAGILASPKSPKKIPKEPRENKSGVQAKALNHNSPSAPSSTLNSILQESQGSLSKSVISAHTAPTAILTSRRTSESPRTLAQKKFTKRGNDSEQSTKATSNPSSSVGIFASPRSPRKRLDNQTSRKVPFKDTEHNLGKSVTSHRSRRVDLSRIDQTSSKTKPCLSDTITRTPVVQQRPVKSDAIEMNHLVTPTKSRWNGPFQSINSASMSHFEHIRASMKTNDDLGLQGEDSNMWSGNSNPNTKQSRPQSPTMSRKMNSFAVTTTGPQPRSSPRRSPSRMSNLDNTMPMSPRGRHAHLGISRLDDLERRSRPTSLSKRVTDRRMMRPDRSASPRRPTNEKQERFRQAGIERFRRAGMGILQSEKAVEKSTKRR